MGLETTEMVDFFLVSPCYGFLLWGTGHRAARLVIVSSLCDLEPYLTCLSIDLKPYLTCLSTGFFERACMGHLALRIVRFLIALMGKILTDIYTEYY